MKRYAALSVHVSPEGIAHDDAVASHAISGEGFCDGLFAAFITYRENGPAVLFYGFDGRASRVGLTAGPLFYIWTRIAETLSGRTALNDGFRSLCTLVWDSTKKYVTKHEHDAPEKPRYHLRFMLKSHVSAEEAAAYKLLAADAIIVAALGFEAIPFEIDLRDVCARPAERVDDTVWWHVWIFLGKYILDHYEVPPHVKTLLQAVSRLTNEAFDHDVN